MSSKQIPQLPPAGPLDGTELVHVVQAGSSRWATAAALFGGAYHYGSFAVAAIGSSEILMDHIVATAHTLSDDFAGCVAGAGVAPAADWVASIQLNGVAIGTLTIHADGTHAFVTTGGSVAVAAGDVVTLIAPAGIDAALARLRFTFKGAI
jgi:hypothetical protein